MEKSLLSILEAEEQVVRKINYAEKEASYFQRKREEISCMPFECKGKETDLASCDKFIAFWKDEAEEKRMQLDSVRGELREYLAALFK